MQAVIPRIINHVVFTSFVIMIINVVIGYMIILPCPSIRSFPPKLVSIGRHFLVARLSLFATLRCVAARAVGPTIERIIGFAPQVFLSVYPRFYH